MKGLIFCAAAILLSAGTIFAQEGGQNDSGQESSAATSEKLAKKLQNPVASLISVPLQNNFEYKLGPEKKGFRYTLRFQPVVPFSLNEDWNFIFRPIVPYISQRNVIGGSSQEGFGDIELEPFFSPKEPGPGGLIWGVGPVLLFPTAASKSLGLEKYGAGPNGVVLKQSGPWTAGILANHTWSYAGNDAREDISATYLQPFFSHTSKKGFTISFSSESTYNWESRSWTVPLIGGVSQVIPFFGRFLSAGISGIYYPQTPSGGPKWGIRAVVTLLLPEKTS